MHTAAVDTHHRLGQEAGGHAVQGGHLPADQIVELNRICSSQYLGVAIVDFELRRRNLRVILLVLEAHRALHLGHGVNELAQRVAGERVVVAVGVDELELAGLVILALGVNKKPSISLEGFRV